MPRFIDPTTDFGFKKLFGEEANKDITMSLLSDLLEFQAPLLDINFVDKEQLPETKEERSEIYDIYCKDVEGNYFIVEMQKNRIAFTKDRMVYYSTFPIVAQAKKGRRHFIYPLPPFEDLRIRDVSTVTYGEKVYSTSWDFHLDGVYCIAILNYALDGSTTAVNRSSIRNDQPPYEKFFDKLTCVTVELPLFDERKPAYSLERHLNQWLYFLKYLPMLDDIPDIFRGAEIFEKAFRVAEYANLTPKERRRYELNLKRMRDTHAVIATSFEEGKAKGHTEGMIEGKIETLLFLLSQKLGKIPFEIEETIQGLNKKEIDHLLTHFLEISDWNTLQKYLPVSAK